MKKDIYSNLLGTFLKNGKKAKAKKLLDKSLSILSNKTGISSLQILLLLYKRLNVFMEAKTLRVRRRTHIVPFSTSLNRRFHLVSKWLMAAVLKNKKRISISEKLSEEILLICKKHPSKSMEMRNLNNGNALRFRSNLHFRW